VWPGPFKDGHASAWCSGPRPASPSMTRRRLSASTETDTFLSRWFMPSPAKYKFRLTNTLVLRAADALLAGTRKARSALLYDAAYGARRPCVWRPGGSNFVLKCLLGLVIGVAWLSMVFLDRSGRWDLCQCYTTCCSRITMTDDKNAVVLLGLVTYPSWSCVLGGHALDFNPDGVPSTVVRRLLGGRWELWAVGPLRFGHLVPCN